MLFALICTDKAGALQTRLDTRPTHLAYLDSRVTEIVRGGALLDEAGNPSGSLLIIDVADQAAADAFAAEDPYARAGLFQTVVVRPFRMVFRDGARAA